MGKEEEVGQRSGIAITFESLVGIRALLIDIDKHKIDKHEKPWLFSSMNFLVIDGDALNRFLEC